MPECKDDWFALRSGREGCNTLSVLTHLFSSVVVPHINGVVQLSVERGCQT